MRQHVRMIQHIGHIHTHKCPHTQTCSRSYYERKQVWTCLQFYWNPLHTVKRLLIYDSWEQPTDDFRHFQILKLLDGCLFGYPLVFQMLSYCLWTQKERNILKIIWQFFPDKNLSRSVSWQCGHFPKLFRFYFESTTAQEQEVTCRQEACGDTGEVLVELDEV